MKIALLLGGTSPEREVSKKTSKSILGALRELGHEVIPIDPAYGLNQPKDENDFFAEKDYTELSNKNYIDIINSQLFDDIDLAFLALHGRWGEDGTIQSLLEMRGTKYTGSGILTSSLAMDKAMTKVVIQHFGVSTPSWIVADINEKDFLEYPQKIKNQFGYPCIIKPNDQGSSVSLTVCKFDADVIPAIKLALQFSDKALIEEFIPGRELTVAVLDGVALPILEIVPKGGLYDYESKYTSGKSEYIVPAPMPEEVRIDIQDQAVKAFNAVGCKCYSRIDFRLTEENKEYCLEINTLPGMTSLSLVPKAAAAAGISFVELIDRIVQNAVK
ncbi:MAG: D-alanine--D-alanine ligase [Stygiobacter sp. RIFOXYC12_FULL_38_8]|nr:MAG: D-alanine--D-alanine ligase [Stygiobacter sp. GWC2_38_9]OGU78074.1 MAG: D-alanine--D-alanine ligase [Stygiobacter sp. RIFOXYA12_FULL_38_9]OGV09548.1 MAG: D-alanine--D-alanine ligase [Stygiobacter sp. RIFOXYB2_FULL_37_11]OGV13927.1 MAG: D-alanine--D-alanine ligase [Stygiobacter sp. RIFOXYC2_FULL_38_25]OGV15413.1 MAG: D-alanine--D-alanine ligase [Stygiobacter sp. RIFOXYA2_FULL_38_8]OGV28229.1 MAG: D-alanine--D-alanine ligase [Stygiobacter sp. RIFOXYC12_FULL_38_8]OGV82627.1 MAG: D-alanin